MNMRIFEPREITYKSALPCDLCGDQVRTVNFYLQWAADRKVAKGFYPDLSVRLCEKCVREALSSLEAAK